MYRLCDPRISHANRTISALVLHCHTVWYEIFCSAKDLHGQGAMVSMASTTRALISCMNCVLTPKVNNFSAMERAESCLVVSPWLMPHMRVRPGGSRTCKN
eukprot:359469-Chlamydomonas_euryale.AAC.13